MAKCYVHALNEQTLVLPIGWKDRLQDILFRFTKFWEKNIVIIREKWSVGIMINKEWLEPRLA
jgi:hypothetical protein